MKKSRLGLSVGLLAAIMYFVVLFGGTLPALLILGYVLFCEKDLWLRKNCTKALVISLGVSVIHTVLGLLPSLLEWIDTVAAVFRGGISYSFVQRFLNVFTVLLQLLKTVLLLVMGLMAIAGKSVPIPFLDKFLDHHLDSDEAKPAPAYTAPVAPVTPVVPETPAAPVVPVVPEAPAAPVAPVVPEAPASPAAPVVPETPAAPVAPVVPEAPAAPVAPVAPAAPQPPKPAGFCPNCGHPLHQGDAFCPDCGEKIHTNLG